MANETPPAMILLEAPYAVSVVSIEPIGFDSLMSAELVTAESCKSNKVLVAHIACVHWCRLYFFSSVYFDCDSC